LAFAKFPKNRGADVAGASGNQNSHMIVSFLLIDSDYGGRQHTTPIE
jgi:hypothetical protein